MATTNLGRVAYVDKGAYNAATTYKKKDVVLYQNGSYVYINNTPPAGNVPTNATYWQVMLDPTDMNAAAELFYSGGSEPSSPNVKVWLDVDEPDLLLDFEQRIAALEALHS